MRGMIAVMRPEQLLFTDAATRPIALEDLISEGLDGGYLNRVPALVDLMHAGEPRDRLYACLLLCAWGVADGFESLIAWANSPDDTPWGNRPVEIDRRYGV